MLFVASTDDLVRPNEEHAGEEAGVHLEARLIADLFIDLELLL